jgi:BlaI family penicillinase repressor
MQVLKLTRAEEELMLVLWKLERAFLKDLLDGYAEPKPNVSTIATILRTLERKGFVAHRAYSKVFEYYPLVQRRQYVRNYFAEFRQKYFDNNLEEMVRFISGEIGMELRAPGAEERASPKPENEKPDVDESQLSLF